MYTMVSYSTYLPLVMVTIFVLISSLQECYRSKDIFSSTCHNSVESDAIILNIELIKAKEAGSSDKIKFRVHVQPARKRSYVTEFHLTASSFLFNQLEIGSKIRIQYDPRNPKNILLVQRC